MEILILYNINISRDNIEAQERCDFDLCCSCAEKKDIENVCPRGHQLHPVQLSGDYIFGWSCDGCGYQCSPADELVVVTVWRCEKDIRHPELMGPWGAQAGETMGLTEDKVSFSSQFISLSNKTDQGSQSVQGGALTTAEED